MTKNLYSELLRIKQQGKKKFAVLIDPDKTERAKLEKLVNMASKASVDYFFVGGSLMMNDGLDMTLEIIRKNSEIPSILFPGSSMQINNKADAIFFLSLISGRNAELLIGQQVISAPTLRNSGLEIIPTGYLLVNGGVPTAVSYISNTTPVPSDKDDIAACTAMAGEMLGLKTIYMDAGSGAKNPISESMISQVSKNVNIPIIVGGGIRTPDKVLANCKAGADVIVVGNAIEENGKLIEEMSNAVHNL